MHFWYFSNTLVSSLLKDPDNFIAYCKETKRLYVEECGFYPLSPTGHKILDHPEHYLTVFPSTIATGMTSEEPAEGANKFVKRFQVENAFQGDLQSAGCIGKILYLCLRVKMDTKMMLNCYRII